MEDGTVILDDPCCFSPRLRHARALAQFQAARFQPGQRILDIGFGQGYFLDAARERGFQAIGVDRDAALTAAARDSGHEVFCGHVRELSELASEPFDGAVAAHLIEHLEPEEVRTLCADVADMVRSGGIFLIATPNFRDFRVATEWFWLDPTHIRPYPEGALAQLIDNDEWMFDASGLEPTFLGRDTPRVLLNRLRYGRHYGRPGNWYQLRRA